MRSAQRYHSPGISQHRIIILQQCHMQQMSRETWYAAGHAPRQPPGSSASRIELLIRTAHRYHGPAFQQHRKIIPWQFQIRKVQSSCEPCAWQAELPTRGYAPVIPPRYCNSRMERTVRTDSCDLGATPPRQRAYVLSFYRIVGLSDVTRDSKRPYRRIARGTVPFNSCIMGAAPPSRWGDVALQDNLLLFRCACQLRDPTRPHFTPKHWLLCHMGL